jgi:hypothetical protein
MRKKSFNRSIFGISMSQIRVVGGVNVKKLSLLFAFVASVSVSQAATISNGLGLNIDTFPGTGTIEGPSFTDSMGNVLTLGSSFFISAGVWFGAGNLTATFVSPVNAVDLPLSLLADPRPQSTA